MTREPDIRQALSLGADYLGFIVYPKSPRALTLQRAAELSALVPQGKRVVVDVDVSLGDLKRYQEAGFDRFQIHVNLPSDQKRVADYSDQVGREHLWLAPRLAPADAFPEWMLAYADTILLDTYSGEKVGGTGHTGDFKRFAGFKQQFANNRWILAGGLNPSNIKAALEQSMTQQVDVNSGVESVPGVKDAEKLRAFFQALKQRH